MTLRPLPLIAALLLACGCAATAPQADTASASAPATDAVPAQASDNPWLADVEAMSASDDNGARRAAIERRLLAIGLQPRAQRFESGNHKGQNLLADVSGPTDAPVLLVGAHYDRVKQGRGATDNASGSATVIALAERFRKTPLQHHRLVVAFWDLEELGLVGSRAYVEQGGAKPAMYVNFDVFGWGDTLWMMTLDANDALAMASKSGATGAGIGFSAGDKYPPTDHLAFQKAGWPAVSYSLVGGDEIAAILKAYSGKQPTTAPKVMQVIHSDGDTVDKLDPAATAKGVDAVEAALRAWDAGGK